MKILGVISIVFIVCALICGMWIKFHPQGNDLNFHFMLSLVAMLTALVTIVLFIVRK